MSDEDKKPWIEKAKKLKEQFQEEYEQEVGEQQVHHRTERQEVALCTARFELNSALQVGSGYATRGSAALASGPAEWCVASVTYTREPLFPLQRDPIEMNNLGAPNLGDSLEARALIGELGIIGNPFKASATPCCGRSVGKPGWCRCGQITISQLTRKLPKSQKT